MYLIVGLGNPGTKYEGTRHNLGFLVADKLAQRWAVSVDKRRFEGRTGGGLVKGQQSLILKPETFMNNSGISVRAALDFYKLEPKDLVIILDDLALPVGQVRVRPQGSAGGHNGLADVINKMGTDRVGRVRVGIGSPPPMMSSVDYVLGRFTTDERPLIDRAVEEAADAVETILVDGYPKAMEKFNRAKGPDAPEEPRREPSDKKIP